VRVFLSWSGDRSRRVALALRDWLPDVVQEAQPFMSQHDIGAGARWGSELGKTLECTDIGILCLTPENLAAPWMVFEAGCLAKKLESSRVIPYRLGLKATEVPFPLAQFQSVDADREGTLRLLQTLNALRAQAMESERLDRLFSRLWRDLEADLRAASSAQPDEPKMRSDRDLIEEILGPVRHQQQASIWRDVALAHGLGFEHIDAELVEGPGLHAEVYWHERGFTRDEALELCGVLRHSGISSLLAEHSDEQAPDAVFIGALVPAEAARTALRALPYKAKYIFRPDYPEEMGGSTSGLLIGIGYSSSHAHGARPAIAEPVPLTDSDFAKLTEPGISNTEFHRRLREITRTA